LTLLYREMKASL